MKNITLALTSFLFLFTSVASGETLYKRLGGKKAIKLVVDDFVTNCATDKKIKKFFTATASNPKRLKRFKKALVDQICEAAGGPCKYKGMDMKSAHKGMGIKSKHFNALVDNLVKSLNKFKVGKKEKGELLAVLGPMKADIVENRGKRKLASRNKSLYEKLGGKKAIKAVVDDFVAKCATDPRIKKFFEATASDKKRLRRLKKQLVTQICQASGGPCKYTGMDMKTAHKGMGVKGPDFDALVDNLAKTLDKFKVKKKEKSQLLAALAPMKKDIVER